MNTLVSPNSGANYLPMLVDQGTTSSYLPILTDKNVLSTLRLVQFDLGVLETRIKQLISWLKNISVILLPDIVLSREIANQLLEQWKELNERLAAISELYPYGGAVLAELDCVLKSKLDEFLALVEGLGDIKFTTLLPPTTPALTTPATSTTPTTSTTTAATTMTTPLATTLPPPSGRKCTDAISVTGSTEYHFDLSDGTDFDFGCSISHKVKYVCYQTHTPGINVKVSTKVSNCSFVTPFILLSVYEGCDCDRRYLTCGFSLCKDDKYQLEGLQFSRGNSTSYMIAIGVPLWSPAVSGQIVFEPQIQD